MKNLNSLNSLILKMTREELKSANKFFDYYSESKSKTKSSDLVKLLVEKKEFNARDIQTKLYGKQNLFAFNKLINRTKEKLLEVALFDSNISKNYYTDRVRVSFELKKKLIQCDILNMKGLKDDSDLMCKKIIAKAEMYELYDIVTSAYIIRRRFINIRKKNKELNNLIIEIESAEFKNKTILSAQIIYDNILNKISNTANSEKYYQELKKSINSLEEMHKIFDSNIIGYNLNFLKTQLYQIDENYEDANKCLSNMIVYLKNKSMYTEFRLGATLLNISNNNIYLNKDDYFLKNPDKLKKYFSNNIINQSLVDELVFYYLFYNNNYTDAEIVIMRLVNVPIANNIPSIMKKWPYLFAALKFRMGEFIKCKEMLNNLDEFGRENQGWNINMRLLIIMTNIELNQYEICDQLISNLEKYIKRSQKNNIIQKRYIIISRILIKLVNSNYQFKSVLATRKKYFDLLQSDDVNFKWKIKSPELIDFNNWYLQRMLKEK